MSEEMAAQAPVFHPVTHSGLAVVLRRVARGPVLARERVTAGDLAEAGSEAWRECCLRKGLLDVGFADVALRVAGVPGEADSERPAGFVIEVKAPGRGGVVGRVGFTIRALEPVARRAEARVVRDGGLAAGDEFVYELSVDADGEPPGSPGGEEPGASIEVTFKDPPVHFLQAPLAPLLDVAREEGESLPSEFPVFYTSDARGRAEDLSRKGDPANPNFESGCVLAGPLCSCPESGAFFVVVTDVFEVTDARSSLVSLEYSGKSWAHIRTMIRARQKHEPSIRVLGQAHGHNWLPNNGETCKECRSRPVCNVSNLFASREDRNWTRAVFARQPWSLCHIFGRTARGDRVSGLYTQHDGRLSPRRYHVIPGFDPWNHRTQTTQLNEENEE